jgi:Flp pilus assembly protein TadD/peroxiredoxin
MSLYKERKPPSRKRNEPSRRTLLKAMGFAPLVFRAAPFWRASLLSGGTETPVNQGSALPYADFRLRPHYPVKPPLTDLLRLIAPGSDEYLTEKYAAEIGLLLNRWSEALKISAHDGNVALASVVDSSISASTIEVANEKLLRLEGGVRTTRRVFREEMISGRESFLQRMDAWLGRSSGMRAAEFEITAIDEIAGGPLSVRLDIRYHLVFTGANEQREERIGYWNTEWTRDASQAWKARKWGADEETVSTANGTAFIDVTKHALGGTESYASQLPYGADYWRTVLDGACGIDVYGNNGLAAGDFDNDGFDDLYICQPAGLPNRLYRNRGDGTFEDVTEKAGVGVLDNTACALFADFENKGLQDLLVVCGSGPLLFVNRGDGSFAIKRDAFKFELPPQGTFTHAAVADYDRDGRLDIYFCLYSYYLGLDQYHYPVPYFDARNGPPNFLFHNEGNGTFVDKTRAAGLNVENDRYSFACAWGDSQGNGLADLYVANDFGRGNLYRNNGDGTFTAVSTAAHVDDPEAGMSASWLDSSNDGKQDIYSAAMWSAAGQRVSSQKMFQPKATEEIRSFYRRHARGNTLFRNRGDGSFENVSRQAGVELGRWSWCADSWDFDHDGYADIYVTNGYISAPDRADLSSFFWRQVVGKSPDDSTPSLAYERGWQALNELIRSDGSWSGYERNVMFANNHDGTFSEVSGLIGLDALEDSRSFVLADLDHDGRLEVILKNRNSPQLRIFHNGMTKLGDSICFRLRGTKSNRDSVGAAITVESGTLRQTKYLQAGTGFLAQHSKEVFFGLGKAEARIKATIRWPSGETQEFADLPANHRVEIEEGSTAVTAKRFELPPAGYSKPGAALGGEELPSQVATWIIQPLKAPQFSLPDLAGNQRELGSFRDGYVLLHFWAVTAPLCGDQLKVLHRSKSMFAAGQLILLAINVDEPADQPAARSFAMREGLDGSVLFGSEEVAGTYNLVYRYLFDRRRDLAIPTSFLLDKEGMIVKVYQGPIDPRQVMEDVRSIPQTDAERIQKALPFAGSLYQGTFQRNDFTYGVAMLQHGYLQQAEESFQQVVATKPDNAEGYYNLGTLSLQRKDLAQARQYLEKTLKLRSNYPEAWNNLGMIAAQEGHADEAIQNFQRSLQLRPAFTIALLNLGNVYRRQGAFDKAEEYLDHALETQPDDPEINYSLGLFYAQQGQTQRAVEYWRKAIDLRPDYPEALNNLGVLYVREKDYAQAEELFQTCIRLAPTYDQSYLNLARLCAIQGDKDGARAVLLQLLRLQPENSGAKQAMDSLQ